MFRSVDAMTWTQLHERMAFMADLIDRAADEPEAALDLCGNLSDVERLFGGEAGLLLSLQHRWVTMLTAKLDQAAHDDVPAERARAELAARHPGLRALLDAAARRTPRVRSLQRDEEHIVKVFDGLPAGDATGAQRAVA
jgi:ATP adenylyltransferase